MARYIPVTDIDDTGRVNPYPLYRVEVVDKQSEQVLAATDATVSVGKDFHCRECHAKGKIAANDQLDWSKMTGAYHSSSAYGKECSWQTLCSTEFTPPTFFESVDRDGNPSTSLFDQEYAAIKNANSLHSFYDNVGTIGRFEFGDYWDGEHHVDWPATCTACHQVMLKMEVGFPTATNPGNQHGDDQFFPQYTQAMHRFHGQLQRDPNDSGKILRESSGRPLRWDPAKGQNPNSLFAEKDAQGRPLPDEQNCTRCHAGHREPLYRDRHATVGVTCTDCHGGMLAVGMTYPKPKPGPEGLAERVDWYDQPDCGSCHTGNGNEGKDGANGFFSAGVKTKAYEQSDLSATPRTPESERFSVTSSGSTEIFFRNWIDKFFSTRYNILNLTNPVYRKGHDTHGNVACGACHGGAHEVWPNRDPKSNDNVAAQQLQGFTGPIMECSVCHTKDAFAEFQNLDGGQFSGLPADSGILGGPHGMHPLRDDNWWRQAASESLPSGLHDNYYRSLGQNGEDQCAACHGEDHKGTRLSKTPVDLSFKLANGTVAKWKAGEAVGCNKCHSIAKSFRNGPTGYVAPPVNHDPVITSVPASLNAILDTPYGYQVTATDQDGDALTYSLGLKPGSMTISEQGLVTSNWPMDTFSAFHTSPLTFPYVVTVRDGKGGYATQTVNMTLECPAGTSWYFDPDAWKGSCAGESEGGVSITSKPPTLGIDAGASYSYQIVASSAANDPLTYSLTGQPDDMAIDESGLINWVTSTTTSGIFNFRVVASDGKGGRAVQPVSLTVCAPPQKWHAEGGHCM